MPRSALKTRRTTRQPKMLEPQRILQSLTDGLLVVDRERRILEVNDRLAAYYGMRPEALRGKPCYEVIGFDHCKTCPHADLLRGHGAQEFNAHNLRCGRFEHGPFCVTATPLRDAQGNIEGLVEVFRDMRALGDYIEELEHKNLELEHERQRLDTLLSESSDGYYTAALDRTILHVDRKLLELLGRPESEVVGRSCADVFGSDKCDTDCPILWARDKQKNVIDCHEQFRTAQGVVPVNKSILLHKDPQGRVEHVIGVLRNVSEIVELRRTARRVRTYHRLVSRNRKMEDVFQLIHTFGPTEAAVLILGESGTGKELVAEALQERSRRKDRPFRKVNCSALAEGLLESELFGHVRGAFTGATQDKHGLFEAADGGTLFLDEVGDMSPNLQTKVLRVLEQQEFERVGSTRTVRVDVRILAATNKDLRRAIQEGSFREDLYYRLNAIQIRIPALRERRDDIPLLVERFLQELDEIHGRGVVRISSRALDLLQRYDWPGNVRELRNAMEFAYVCARGDRIERQDLPESIRFPEVAAAHPTQPHAQDDGDRRKILEALQRFHGRRDLVARHLGISRTTLWRRLKKLDLDG